MKCWKCYENSQYGEQVYVSIRSGESEYKKYRQFLCRACLFFFAAYRDRPDIVEHIQSRDKKINSR